MHDWGLCDRTGDDAIQDASKVGGIVLFRPVLEWKLPDRLRDVTHYLDGFRRNFAIADSGDQTDLVLFRERGYLVERTG